MLIWVVILNVQGFQFCLVVLFHCWFTCMGCSSPWPFYPIWPNCWLSWIAFEVIQSISVSSSNMYRIWTEEGITIMFVSSFLVDFGYTGNVKFPTSNSFQCEMEWGFIYGRSFLNPCSWNITCWNSCGLLYLLQRATWKPAFQKFYFHTIVATDKKYSFLIGSLW